MCDRVAPLHTQMGHCPQARHLCGQGAQMGCIQNVIGPLHGTINRQASAGRRAMMATRPRWGNSFHNNFSFFLTHSQPVLCTEGHSDTTPVTTRTLQDYKMARECNKTHVVLARGTSEQCRYVSPSLFFSYSNHFLYIFLSPLPDTWESLPTPLSLTPTPAVAASSGSQPADASSPATGQPVPPATTAAPPTPAEHSRACCSRSWRRAAHLHRRECCATQWPLLRHARRSS